MQNTEIETLAKEHNLIAPSGLCVIGSIKDLEGFAMSIRRDTLTEIDNHPFICSGCSRQIRELAAGLGGWISVEETLPTGIVIACFKPTRTNQRIIIRAQYFRQFEEPSEGDTDNFEYNAADDTSYIPAGWYECMSNWDDYSSFFVDGIVTHWMPLPKPPNVELSGRA